MAKIDNSTDEECIVRVKNPIYVATYHQAISINNNDITSLSGTMVLIQFNG